MNKRSFWISAPFIVAMLLLMSTTVVFGQADTIRLTASNVTSEFPKGIRFRAEVSGVNEITSIAVRFRIGRATRGVFDYLDFESGTEVDSELLWRTNSLAGYIPPGTVITYNFEIEDVSGNRLYTESKDFIYHDIRFDWAEVSEGAVVVAYHGPVKQRAETVRDAIIETLEFMGPILGADIQEPIRVTMYNNTKEMLEALPPGSTTIRRELITEGQAFVNIGTLLVLGGGRMARGTASHEATHILTHRAGDSVFRTVPRWLDEGLAEYGNIDPGFSYEIALEFAVETGQLLPITSTRTLPSSAEDVMIFYGEARSIVRFMVGTFGRRAMQELMAAMKTGMSVDKAIEQVYGIDHTGLENLWRANIGAPPYEPVKIGRSLPTRVPRTEVLPYSLTPQPRSETIGDKGATPIPVSRPTEMPALELGSAMVANAPDTPTFDVSPTTTEPGRTEGLGGGGCSSPSGGESGAIEISASFLLIGSIGLRFLRRRRQ